MALTKVIGAGIGSVSGVNLSSGNVTVVDGQGFYFGDGSYRIEGKDDGATTARIGFVAGGSEVARFTSSGLTFGGDTATANALDDYEEGTWTPAFDDAGGGTFGYSSQSGTYTKIGRLVYCQFSIVVSSVSSLSGSIMRITGQPFSSNSDENMVVTRYQNFTSGAPHRGNASGSNSVNIKSEGTNDNGNFPSSNTTSSAQLIGQIMFTTS